MAFSKFIMVDSGRAIHINPQYVEQVRDGPEYGTTGLYFNARSQPIIVQESAEKALKTMFGPEQAVAVKARPITQPAAKSKPMARVVSIAKAKK